MQVKCLTVGPLQTNCYLLTDEGTRQTIIIDPGDEADFITTTILENKLSPTAILLTHGHYDHCLGALELKLNFDTPIYLHKDDYLLYQKAHDSATFWSKPNTSSVIPGQTRNPSPIPKLPPINHILTNNQTISFGESSLQVVHTPGHTPGSCCFLVSPSVIASFGTPNRGNPSPSEAYLFSGDTLFATGPGKADHKYSSKLNLKNSLLHLQSTIQDLKSTIYIYPGHEDWGFTAPQLLS